MSYVALEAQQESDGSTASGPKPAWYLQPYESPGEFR